MRLVAHKACLRAKIHKLLIMRMETNFTATMAPFTQNEESFSNDSNYYTYTKSTDRISNNNLGHLLELDNNNEKDGVLSNIRANGVSTNTYDLTH